MMEKIQNEEIIRMQNPKYNEFLLKKTTMSGEMLK